MPVVPISFEAWLAKHDAETPQHATNKALAKEGRCDSCGRKAKILSRDGRCEPCLRYSYGGDEAEREVVIKMLGGAVKGALDAHVPVEMVREAVEKAIDHHHFEEGRSAGRHERRAAA